MALKSGYIYTHRESQTVFPGEKKTKNKKKGKKNTNKHKKNKPEGFFQRGLSSTERAVSTGAAASRGRAEGAAARWVQGTRRPLESSRFVGFWGQNLRRRCWGAHRPEPAARKQTKVKVPGAATEQGLVVFFFCQPEKRSGGGRPAEPGGVGGGDSPPGKAQEGLLGVVWGGWGLHHRRKALGPFVLPYQQQSSCPQPLLVV